MIRKCVSNPLLQYFVYLRFFYTKFIFEQIKDNFAKLEGKKVIDQVSKTSEIINDERTKRIEGGKDRHIKACYNHGL